MPEDESDRQVPMPDHAAPLAPRRGRSMACATPEAPMAAGTQAPVPAAAGGRNCGRRLNAAVRVRGAACGPRVNLRVNLLLPLRGRGARAVLRLRRWTALPGFSPTGPRRHLRRGEWSARSAFQSRRWISDRAG